MQDETTPQDDAAMSPASDGSVCDRITAYLVSGGLFNPEPAIHDRVRDLLIDCRDEIEQLRGSLEWHKETLVEAEEVMCRKNLTDAEREVLGWAIEVSDSLAECGATGTGGKESHESSTLRGLLERLG